MHTYDEVGGRLCFVECIRNAFAPRFSRIRTLPNRRKQGHSHFYAPWSYLVCFKSTKTRENWYRTSARIEIELHRRLHGTKSGEPALLYFDAPTMIGYQVPPRYNEATHCRKEVVPWECEENAGVRPHLVGAGGNAMGKPVFSPVLDRHPRMMSAAEATEETNSSVVDRLWWNVQETIGKRWQPGDSMVLS